MADSCRKKEVKQKGAPREKTIAHGGNPERYYLENPAWAFVDVDQEMWPFSKEHIGDYFWTKIFPRLQAFETQTWNEILIRNKKQNHPLDLTKLNKAAQIRLASRHIEVESLISLRINSTHRLYGYMTGRVFNILWYDDDHGDNDTCVCRSHLKHT